MQGTRAVEQAPEHAPFNYFNYFTEIEDTFIRRRGKHLLLSPLDWALIESWKEMGVPLHIVLRGIEKSFDSHAARPRNRSVKSLMYCQEEVEAQFAEWLEGRRGAGVETENETESDAPHHDPLAHATGETPAHATGETPVHSLPFPRPVIDAHLAECRTSLARARDCVGDVHNSPEMREALSRAVVRLEELEKDFAAAARPSAEQLENSLTDLESLLDRALRATARPEQLSKHRSVVEEQLRPYRNRMERVTYEQTLDNLLAKLLREECGVPRLSLFYL